MKLLKKSFIVLFIAFFGFWGFGVLKTKAATVSPFTAIWYAIHSLQTALSNIQLIPGPQGPTGPQGPAGVQGIGGQQLHLYDANSQDLGVLVDRNNPDGYTSYFSNEQIFLEFSQGINNNGSYVSLYNNTVGSVYYLQQNCQGNPYANNTGFFHRAFIIDANGSLPRLFKHINGPPLINSGGTLTLSALGSSGCSNQGAGGAGTLLPVQEIPFPFTLPLVGPLHIQ